MKTLDGGSYEFELVDLYTKTRIQGEQYDNFLADFNMQHGEAIRFEMERHNPYYLTVIPLNDNDEMKERVEVEGTLLLILF